MTLSHEISDVDMAIAYLQEQIANIADPKLQELASWVFKDEKYVEAPASTSFHHVYVGGLVVHTAQLLKIAIDMLRGFPGANLDAVRVAVIWHDYHKVKEYVNVGTTEQPTFMKTQYARNIGHVAGSYADMFAACTHLNIAYETDDSSIVMIGNIMLAHHGRMEWGSPVLANSPEAWAVHSADMMSAQFTSDAAIEHSARGQHK